MNIFVTDMCPTFSAINLPDIRVREMIVDDHSPNGDVNLFTS